MDFKVNKSELSKNIQNSPFELSIQNEEFEQIFSYESLEKDRNEGLIVENTSGKNTKAPLGNGIYLITEDDNSKYYLIEITEFNKLITDVSIDQSLPRKYINNGKPVTDSRAQCVFSFGRKSYCNIKKIDKEVLSATNIDKRVQLKEVIIVAKKTDTITKLQNTGNIGYIVFQPKRYKNQSIIEKDTRNTSFNSLNNTKEEIERIELLLKNKVDNNELEEKLVKQLIKELKRKNIAFAHQTDQNGNFVNESEFSTLTNEDIELLLRYSKLAESVPKNDIDGLHHLEYRFRQEYFSMHRQVVDPETVNANEILNAKTNPNEYSGRRLLGSDSTEVSLTQSWGIKKGKGIKGYVPSSPSSRNNKSISNKDKQEYELGYYKGFRAVQDKGINPYYDNNQMIPDSYRVLAECGSNVALDMSTSGQCMTGFKLSLLTAGVINDYADMVDGNNKSISRPRDAVKWFKERPDKFTEVKYIRDADGSIRLLNSTDLRNLPAGYMILWVPEQGDRFSEREGHACITNGNGQAYADETDNLEWESFAKGEHGTFYVFKLNQDNWQFNVETQKLQYVKKRK